MADDNLLSIGAFSLLVGLSVAALRHYDDVGVLKPFAVDPKTNYRYYSYSQVGAGRIIRALRDVDLPLDVFRDVSVGDASAIRNALVGHRDDMARRADVITHQLETLNRYIEEGVPMTVTTRSRIAMINIAVNDLAAARTFYETVFDAQFNEDDHDGHTDNHLQATFGTWGEDTFFLMQVYVSNDHAGNANIGFLVDDLDAAYARALKAGAKSEHPPKDLPGMPRVAQIWDPSGNAIGLYQDLN